jgi:hypothetical protein
MTKSHRAARDIPQSQRDKLKDSDFAGPGTSFPIVKPADVSAAAHLIGKAKNPDAVKARIIAIAQRKGKSFTDKLPEAWVKAAAAFDTPAQAASEEAAELITYQTMRDLMDAVGKQWDSASGLVDDLVAAEQEDAATETPAEEEAEEETECSQMESLAVLCGSMAAALMQVQSLCWKELAPDPAYPPRYMEEGGEPKTLVGKTISKNTMKSIQGMHDAAHAAHDHSTALGAQCNGMRLMAAAKMEDCPTCDGSGEVDGNPCETCEGEGEVPIKAAEANDNHDGAVPIIEEGDTYMTKDERNATIKALAACDCSGFKGDAATLETLTDARLEALQAATKQREDAVKTAETATKEATDLKAAAAAVKPVEPKVLTVEEFMAVAPAELKTLIETKKAEDATATATLVAQLKTAQTAYTEDELKALDLVHLRKLASIAKIDAPAPVFTGLSFPRAAAPPVDHTIPPDPYAPGLKALAEQRKH